jgi:hypothetical protein
VVVVVIVLLKIALVVVVVVGRKQRSVQTKVEAHDTEFELFVVCGHSPWKVS